MIAEWNIPAPVGRCAATGREFQEGEVVTSALFWRKETQAYERHDYSLEAWPKALEAGMDGLLSSWKSTYKPPLAEAPETLSKEDAEGLLRRLLATRSPAQANSCYILALMLERKRLIKEVDRKEVEGERVLIYEHVPTGETWIVPNPAMRLDEMDKVQAEVAGLLIGLTSPASSSEATA